MRSAVSVDIFKEPNPPSRSTRAIGPTAFLLCDDGDQLDSSVLAQEQRLGLPPWQRQTDKTQFAVRCKILDRQIHFIAF
jgi:hypothetical protein